MPLLVYKSSAGSGKTTTLVNEYLKITLKNPPVFRGVLAITFTNKAANEMKSRVLDALSILASGGGADNDELKGLFIELGLSAPEIKLRAEKLLSLILHRYDEFAISTIDSFVHRIVRTFATDVKLPQNFEVVIDNEEIIPEIIEKLYEKVNAGNVFTGLMVDFVMKQVDDEKSYDPTRILSEFIQKQLNEESHYHLKKIEHLHVEDFLKIIKKINHLVREKKKYLQEIGSSAMMLIEQNGLESSDLAQGKNGIYNYFLKLEEYKDFSALSPTPTVEKNVEADNWYGSKAKEGTKAKIDAIKGELQNKFTDSGKLISENWVYTLLLEKIHQLALMSEIKALFSEHTGQTQRVHISEFNKKINDQISGQPVPFIYERLGRRYQHFLIDEFQDTSLLQWQNLLPLLEESLASNNLNMLVGDTKQAIYRFRNGEVELFSNLPKIYKNDGSPEMISREKLIESAFIEKTLAENYRSKEEIIHFNNEFFESVKQSVSPWLQNIYKGHFQKITGNPEKKGGYVSVEFIEAENAANYREKCLLQIQHYVEQLLDTGNTRKGICVLSRSNANSSEVAAFLVENGHKVISPESLLLTNSVNVRLVISLLKLVSDSKQRMYVVDFLYNLLLTRNKELEFHQVYSEIKKEEFLDLDKLFSKLEVGIQLNGLSGLTIFEVVELAIRKLGLNKEKDVFLLNFLDFVFENQDVGMGSLSAFLEQWDAKKSKASVITPTEEDAISVMTIHKAKGLKFNNVIVDITDGGYKKGKSEFWAELELDEIKELTIGLMPIKKDIGKAGYGETYAEEEDKTMLDFINMVYVSFTRAVNSMFIITHLKERKSNKLTEFLLSFLTAKGIWQEEKLKYDFGKLVAAKKQNENSKASANWEDFISTDWKSLVSIAPSEEVMWELLGQKPAKSFGNLLHLMLSQIYTHEDVAKVTEAFHHSGIIDSNESMLIAGMLLKIVGHPGLQMAFDKSNIIKNECSIIDKDGNVLRPDKVVIAGDKLFIIDYKTGEKLKKHKDQIIEYGAAFSSLGYQNISQTLVYVNDIVELVEV